MSRKFFRIMAGTLCLVSLLALCACKQNEGLEDPSAQLPDSSAEYGPDGYVPEETEEPEETGEPESEED